MGGRIAEIPVESCSFYHRSARFEIHCIFTPKKESTASEHAILSQFKNAANFYAEQIAALRSDFEFCLLGGGYINTDNLMATESMGAGERVFGSHYHRLREIKSKYDPENFFNKHHPISPLGD